MITGTSGRFCFTFGSISRPVMPGMLMSERIRISELSPVVSTRVSASAAELAKSIAKRWARRSRRNCWRNSASTSGSSSTTRTRTSTSNLWSSWKDCSLLLVSWQCDRELGKLAGLRVDVDGATVLFHDDVMRHRQPEPGAFARRLGREEGVEHLLPHLRRDAGAVVADADLDMVGAASCRGADDRLEGGAAIVRLALAHGIKAVRDQIQEDAGDFLRKYLDHAC